MAETIQIAVRETVLAHLADPRAEGLDVDAWAQILTRSGERLTAPTRSRLATGASRARLGGIPLSIVVETWLAVGHAASGSTSRSEATHRRLVGDGTRALCDGYVDGQEAAARRDERQRALLLDALLSNQLPEFVQELAQSLGIDLTGRRSVLIVGTVSEEVLDRLLDAGALAAPRAGAIVAVIGGRIPRGPEAAGLGRPGLGITGIRRSFADAERALEMARRLGLHGIVPYGDILPESLLAQDRTTLRELVDLTLTPLLTARNGAQYLETAATWLQEGLSVAATARVLAIHERTVRYRLARIAKLTTLDLQHADDRFRLELAIRGARVLANDELEP